MILSASRRTDIPAFYSEWFYNRLKEKFVYVRNPMNIHQVSKIPLTPENIDCIVFWTKDSEPIHKYLPMIDDMGYKYYFQFTITPYDKDMESDIRDKKAIIDTFTALSEKIGKEKVILRYDPIFTTDKGKYTLEFHTRAFERLCGKLHNMTDRVVISFLDGYRKISKNVKEFHIQEPDESLMNDIAENFSAITRKYGLSLETCAEKIDLLKFGINHSKCIDGELIEKIIGCKLARTNKNGKELKDGERAFCGCMKCIDIGQYDTCIHGCSYCYATVNKNKAIENNGIHNPLSPFIMGYLNEETDKVTIRNEKDTKSMKENTDKNVKHGNITDFLQTND